MYLGKTDKAEVFSHLLSKTGRMGFSYFLPPPHLLAAWAVGTPQIGMFLQGSGQTGLTGFLPFQHKLYRQTFPESPAEASPAETSPVRDSCRYISRDTTILNPPGIKLQVLLTTEVNPALRQKLMGSMLTLTNSHHNPTTHGHPTVEDLSQTRSSQI